MDGLFYKMKILDSSLHQANPQELSALVPCPFPPPLHRAVFKPFSFLSGSVDQQDHSLPFKDPYNYLPGSMDSPTSLTTSMGPLGLSASLDSDPAAFTHPQNTGLANQMGTTPVSGPVPGPVQGPGSAISTAAPPPTAAEQDFVGVYGTGLVSPCDEAQSSQQTSSPSAVSASAQDYLMLDPYTSVPVVTRSTDGTPDINPSDVKTSNSTPPQQSQQKERRMSITLDHLSPDNKKAMGSGEKQPQKRQKINSDQLRVLQTEFQKNPNPSSIVRKQISETISMPERSIQIWFQNQRARSKKKRIVGNTSANSSIGSYSDMHKLIDRKTSLAYGYDVPPGSERRKSLRFKQQRPNSITSADQTQLLAQNQIQNQQQYMGQGQSFSDLVDLDSSSLFSSGLGNSMSSFPEPWDGGFNPANSELTSPLTPFPFEFQPSSDLYETPRFNGQKHSSSISTNSSFSSGLRSYPGYSYSPHSSITSNVNPYSRGSTTSTSSGRSQYDSMFSIYDHQQGRTTGSISTNNPLGNNQNPQNPGYSISRNSSYISGLTSYNSIDSMSTNPIVWGNSSFTKSYHDLIPITLNTICIGKWRRVRDPIRTKILRRIDSNILDDPIEILKLMGNNNLVVFVSLYNATITYLFTNEKVIDSSEKNNTTNSKTKSFSTSTVSSTATISENTSVLPKPNNNNNNNININNNNNDDEYIDQMIFKISFSFDYINSVELKPLLAEENQIISEDDTTAELVLSLNQPPEFFIHYPSSSSLSQSTTTTATTNEIMKFSKSTSSSSHMNSNSNNSSPQSPNSGSINSTPSANTSVTVTTINPILNHSYMNVSRFWSSSGDFSEGQQVSKAFDIPFGGSGATHVISGTNISNLHIVQNEILGFIMRKNISS